MARLLAKKWLAAFPLLLSSVTFAGCGKDGPSRLDVWGTITWKGQPIRSGVIFFEPNTTKGNKGPQGFALIKEGNFDSRYERSKGCISGPHIATIQAGDGQNITSGRPYGNSLFASHNLAIDIPPDGGEINLQIPDSVPPAPKTTVEDVE